MAASVITSRGLAHFSRDSRATFPRRKLKNVNVPGKMCLYSSCVREVRGMINSRVLYNVPAARSGPGHIPRPGPLFAAVILNWPVDVLHYPTPSDIYPLSLHDALPI